MDDRADAVARAGRSTTLTHSAPGDVEATATPRLHPLIDEEVTRLKTTPVGAEEIERAYAEFESEFLRELQTASGKADRLSEYATFLDDPGYASKALAHIGRAPQPTCSRQRVRI